MEASRIFSAREKSGFHKYFNRWSESCFGRKGQLSSLCASTWLYVSVCMLNITVLDCTIYPFKCELMWFSFSFFGVWMQAGRICVVLCICCSTNAAFSCFLKADLANPWSGADGVRQHTCTCKRNPLPEIGIQPHSHRKSLTVWLEA